MEIWDWAQIALSGPPAAQKGSNTRSKCVFTMNLTQAGQWGAVGTKSGPRGPSEGLGGPQKGIWGPETSPFRAPWDPEGARYQVKVCVDHESNSGRPMGGSWDQIWPTGALRGPWGPPKGHLGAKTSPFRAPGVQKGPDTRSKCTWIMNLTQAGQCGAVGTKSGPLGPSKDLVGPQKGLLGPKRAPVGT